MRKLCVDCKHFVVEEYVTSWDLCKRPDEYTGRPVAKIAYYERGYDFCGVKCGEEGRFFEQKPEESEPEPERVIGCQCVFCRIIKAIWPMERA